MVVFDSKWKGTGTKSVAIATSKHAPRSVFARAHYHSQVSITQPYYLQGYLSFCVLVLEQFMTSSVI